MVAVAKRREMSGFGDALRTIREGKGLSQTGLGELIGVSYQAVAKYERGTTEPTWPVVLRLAEALGVTPDAFLVGPSPTTDPDPADRPRGKRK